MTKAEEETKSKVEIDKVLYQNRRASDWIDNIRPKMVANIIDSMDDAALIRVQQNDAAGLNKAIKEGNIPELIGVITRAHTTNGASVSIARKTHRGTRC